MSDYLLSILLGILEGLTEFLPVSSTAHLRIAEWLFQIDLKSGYWKMFSIVIQLGAILALTAYFWRHILNLLRTFPRGESGDRTFLTHPLSLVAIAFLFTAVPAFLAPQAHEQRPRPDSARALCGPRTRGGRGRGRRRRRRSQVS